MQKKRNRILIGIPIVVLLVLGAVLFIVPFFKPLEIQGHWIPYTYILHGDSVELVEYCGQESIVNIPEKIMGRPVTKIGEYCFEGNEMIIEVTIPDCVEEIEHRAFSRCKNLQKVKLPVGLKKVSEHTFSSCGLTNIELPNGLEEIRDCAFAYCDGLTQITIPDTVREMGHGAFKCCSNLQTVYIPVGVEKITGCCFIDTPWLENQTEEFVIAGDGVLIQYNGENEKVCIPEGISFLGKCLFDERQEIINIVVPCSVKEIDFFAFVDNKNLEYVVLENSDVILDEVFIYNCPNVTIVSPANSTGQTYAEANGIPWMNIDTYIQSTEGER